MAAGHATRRWRDDSRAAWREKASFRIVFRRGSLAEVRWVAAGNTIAAPLAVKKRG